MKAKTVKRHVIVLDDYEARLIYYVLRYFEGKDFREIDAIGINREKLHELKQSFHELFKERSDNRGALNPVESLRGAQEL
jgi:hypothetical protein